MTSCDKVDSFRSTTSTHIAKSDAITIPKAMAYSRAISTECNELSSTVAQASAPIFKFDEDLTHVAPIKPAPLSHYNCALTRTVYKPAMELVLPSQLSAVYEKCGKNFKSLTQNPDVLSEFFTKLLEEPDSEIINKIISYFESEKYNTALSLKISPQSNSDFINFVKRIAAKFPHIESLTLYNKHITSDTLNKILLCTPALTYLHIDGCSQLTCIDQVTLPESLHTVELTASELDDRAVVKLLTDQTLYLDTIIISNCSKIEFTKLKNVPSCASITRLEITQTDLDDHAMALISRIFPSLEFLSLSGCKKITDLGFNYIKCKHLKSLDLSDTEIGDAALKNLVDSLTELEELAVSHCANLTSQAFYAMNTSSSLVTLIAADTDIDGKALRKIFENSPQLNHLVLSDCQNITRADFVEMPFAQTLKFVDLDYTLIDARGLLQLATRAKNIEVASFSGCENLPGFCRVRNADLQSLQESVRQPSERVAEEPVSDDNPTPATSSQETLFHCE